MVFTASATPHVRLFDGNGNVRPTTYRPTVLEKLFQTRRQRTNALIALAIFGVIVVVATIISYSNQGPTP